MRATGLESGCLLSELHERKKSRQFFGVCVCVCVPYKVSSRSLSFIYFYSILCFGNLCILLETGLIFCSLFSLFIPLAPSAPTMILSILLLFFILLKGHLNMIPIIVI